ncbi:hypothetical protein V6N13_139900 [Hibiscus sabdariffa]
MKGVFVVAGSHNRNGLFVIIQELMGWDVNIHHVSRIANTVVDSLVQRMRGSQLRAWTMENTPIWIHRMMQQEALLARNLLDVG